MNARVIHHRLLLVVFSAFALISFGEAAVAPKPDEIKMKEAAGVIVGTIQHVASETKDGDSFDKQGKIVITYYVSTVKIVEVRKGEAYKVGQEIKIRTMQSEWLGQGLGPPGHSGHLHQPKKGEKVLVYFESKKKGSHFAILQDGMQLVKEEKKPAAP